jgi:RNA polymerase sigma-70 factor (ECF subfamily)
MLDLRGDEHLMLAAKAGDREAFCTLVDRLRSVLLPFLRHLGCDHATAEDLTQETLLRLWCAKDGYEVRASLRTYVLTIAKNCWLSAMRQGRLSSRIAAPLDATLEPLLARDGLRGCSPEAELVNRYTRQRILDAVARLPWRQRIVFVLAHIEHLDYAQISTMLGVAEGTVKSRMHRAVRNLRAALLDETDGHDRKE